MTAFKLSLDRLLEPGHVADILGVTVKTLSWWRTRGSGPPDLKLGSSGSVRYRPDDLEAWLEQHQSLGLDDEAGQEVTER